MLYCPNCDRNTDCRVEYKTETYKVKGEDITVDNVECYFCKNCGKEVFSDDSYDSYLKKAFSKYRDIHHLLMPKAICKIRSMFNLSSCFFSAALGFDKDSIKHFENGSLQNREQDDILKYVHNDVTHFIELYNKNISNVSKLPFNIFDYNSMSILNIINELILNRIKKFGADSIFMLSKATNISHFDIDCIENLLFRNSYISYFRRLARVYDKQFIVYFDSKYHNLIDSYDDVCANSGLKSSDIEDKFKFCMDHDIYLKSCNFNRKKENDPDIKTLICIANTLGVKLIMKLE